MKYKKGNKGQKTKLYLLLNRYANTSWIDKVTLKLIKLHYFDTQVSA